MAILAMPYKIDGLLSFKFWEENFYYVTNSANYSKDRIKAKDIDISDLMLLDDGHVP